MDYSTIVTRNICPTVSREYRGAPNFVVYQILHHIFITVHSAARHSGAVLVGLDRHVIPFQTKQECPAVADKSTRREIVLQFDV